MSTYEYPIEFERVELKPREFGPWLRFPMPTRGTYPTRLNTMKNLKAYLTNVQGLRINVDFKFGQDNDFFPSVRFSPEYDGMRSMLELMWSERK